MKSKVYRITEAFDDVEGATRWTVWLTNGLQITLDSDPKLHVGDEAEISIVKAAELNRLILEAKAEMPCSRCREDYDESPCPPDALCPSCEAREQLKVAT